MVKLSGSFLISKAFLFLTQYPETLVKCMPSGRPFAEVPNTRFCSNNEDENQKQEKISILKDKIEGILAKIDNLVDDKIIRMFVELCFAVLRTNYYLQLFAQP